MLNESQITEIMSYCNITIIPRAFEERPLIYKQLYDYMYYAYYGKNGFRFVVDFESIDWDDFWFENDLTEDSIDYANEIHATILAIEFGQIIRKSMGIPEDKLIAEHLWERWGHESHATYDEFVESLDW